MLVGGLWGDRSPPAAGLAGFGGTVGIEAAWVPAKGSSTLAGFGGSLSRARSQQMALLNAPHSFLLCRHRSEMASPASLCSSSGLGADHRGPKRSPSSPSILALCLPRCRHLLPADPRPQNSCSSAPGCFPGLCFALPLHPGCWVQGLGAEGGVCRGTPA